MAEQPTEKTCTKCGETKPLEEYHRDKNKRGGRAAQCRACASALKKAKGAAKMAARLSTQGKKCAFCKKHHPPSEFDAALTRDGLGNMCRPCKANALSRSDKACNGCGQVKPLDAFNRDSSHRDGRSSSCRQCRQAASRQWRRENKEELGRRRKDAYLRDPEKYRERTRRNYRELEGYRDASLARSRADRLENPHRLWAGHYRERCRRYGLPPVVEDFTKADVIAKYGDHCAYCETGEFEELEHYIPVKAGGPHTLENVRPSCRSCNRAKSDADPEEWLADQAEFDALTEDEQNALIDAEIAKYLNEED